MGEIMKKEENIYKKRKWKENAMQGKKVVKTEEKGGKQEKEEDERRKKRLRKNTKNNNNKRMKNGKMENRYSKRRGRGTTHKASFSQGDHSL